LPLLPVSAELAEKGSHIVCDVHLPGLSILWCCQVNALLGAILQIVANGDRFPLKIDIRPLQAAGLSAADSCVRYKPNKCPPFERFIFKARKNVLHLRDRVRLFGGLLCGFILARLWARNLVHWVRWDRIGHVHIPFASCHLHGKILPLCR